MDGDAPEPIEVELTAHEPRPDRGRRRREWTQPEPIDPVHVEPTDDAPPTRRSSDRTRLLATAAVVGVLALLVGLVIGRSTTDDAVADDEAVADDDAVTTTTVPEPLETLPIVGEEIGGAEFGDEPEEPTPSRPNSTTTGPTTEPVAVDERLLGIPVRLVGVELGGVLVEADLANGTLTEFGADRISTDGIPLVVGDDWIVGSWYGGSRVVRSDGTSQRIDLGEAWQVFHVPDTELFWRMPSSGPDPDGFLMSLVDLAGEPVGPTIQLPPNTWPSVVDPRTGGVVVGGISRNYAIHPDGVDYLGLGVILGVTADLIVTWDCDETLECSLFTTDRTSGEVAAVPVDPDLEPPIQWGTPFGPAWGSPHQLSPDGRWIGLFGSTWTSNVAGILELATGRFVRLASEWPQPTVVWSPDSRFAFTLDGNVPIAHDTTTGDTFPVFADGVRWIQLGARPATQGEPAANGPTLLSASPEEPIEG